MSAALLLLALYAAPASASPEDNSLIVALERFPPGFNPAVASGSLTSQIGAQLFAGLVRTGKDGPIPYLAESWEIDSQAKRFRFHLRKGATFHDGTPITANDVAFSIRAAQRHHPFRTMLEAVDKVVPVDDLTLDLETSIPQPALLKCFIPALVPVLPAHIYGDGTPIDTHPANLAGRRLRPVPPCLAGKRENHRPRTLQRLFPPRQAAPRPDHLPRLLGPKRNPSCDHAGRGRSLRLLFPVG